MKTSIYNIGATALLIFCIYSYNILSMDEQKETNDKIDIINNKLELFGNFKAKSYKSLSIPPLLYTSNWLIPHQKIHTCQSIDFSL